MITSNALAEQCMTEWDLLLTDARIATMRHGAADYGMIDDGAIAIHAGSLAWLGPQADLPQGKARETRSLGGRCVTPALIDCHTHLVFGGDRAAEFEQRLRGASYESIANAGGGILSTVRATRGAGRDELFDAARARVKRLMAGGVATIEVKSGYGLDLDNEIKMLEVARWLDASTDVSIRTSLLAAHTVPPEFDDDADAYIDLICDELLPRVAADGLADAVDAYCESFAFSAEQVDRLFRAARGVGLPVKLHADQLSDGGGAQLAAQHRALSADHLEYTSQAGVEALARAGCVAVLLPGAFLTLQETQRPPLELLRRHGVPIAVATDCNPGTSPLLSLREAMALASRVFGLTPEECLAGTTREAARALGLQDRGTLCEGMRADLAVWHCVHPRELIYWLGAEPLSDLFICGRNVSLARS
jgi:imidazolonepropionase